MSLKQNGRAQRVYPATLKRVQDRAAKLRAADPLHREVTFDQALTWMLDKMDELDQCNCPPGTAFHAVNCPTHPGEPRDA